MAQDESEDDILNVGSDKQYQPIKTLGGKNYEKLKIFSVTEKSCVPTDRRMTSIGQQSVIGKRNRAASPATVCRRRPEIRMKALGLADINSSLTAGSAPQLCYDIIRVEHYEENYKHS